DRCRDKARHEGANKSTRHVPHGAPPESRHRPTTTDFTTSPAHCMRELYKFYLTYSLYDDIARKSSGKGAGEAAANAPRPRRRRTDHGVRIVRLVGGRRVAGWLAGRDRDEEWRVRPDRGSAARCFRERRGGLDRPERLRGRGALPHGGRRLPRGNHRARGPAEGLGARLGT